MRQSHVQQSLDPSSARLRSEILKLYQRIGQPKVRDERAWAIAIRPFYANQKFRTEFPYFSRQERPEFRRKRDLYKPLLTAMAQVLPFLKRGHKFHSRPQRLHTLLCSFWNSLPEQFQSRLGGIDFQTYITHIRL